MYQFKILKIDGPNLMTDKGGILFSTFQYADGGKTKPAGTDDWRQMRDLFVSMPEMRNAVQRLIEHVEGAQVLLRAPSTASVWDQLMSDVREVECAMSPPSVPDHKPDNVE